MFFSYTGLMLMLAILFVGCTSPAELESEPDEAALRARAAGLAQQLLVLDTHIDVPYRLGEGFEDISVRTEGGDFDYPRAKAGGLNAAFMSIYIPAEKQLEQGASRRLADELIDMVEDFQGRWPDKFAVATSTSDVRAHKEAGLISMPMGMENGAGIEDDLANVEHFYDRGIRYITLTHSKVNLICDSSYDSERKWNGLSPFGRQVVSEMNRLGIMVDISHVSDETFHQVIELSRAPVIASHSSCRRFTPGWERNMSDELIRSLADNGGVIQIAVGSSFLDDEYRLTSALISSKLNEEGLEEGDDGYTERRQQLVDEHGLEYADISAVVAHIDHVVGLVGIDHVGLGSDFDGVGDSLPIGFKDVSAFPNLILELLKKGYSEQDIAKICGENLMRVWRQVEEVARESAASEAE